MFLHTKHNHFEYDPLEVVQTLCDTLKDFTDTFDNDMDDLLSFVDECRYETSTPKTLSQVPEIGVVDSDYAHADVGTKVGTFNDVVIYSKVLERMKNRLDGYFTSSDLILILKEFSPQTKKSTLGNRARFYIQYLESTGEITVKKQGRTKLCRFAEKQHEEEKSEKII
jgi:hypothetical protein